VNFDGVFEDCSVAMDNYCVTVRHKTHGPESMCQAKEMSRGALNNDGRG